jgi:alkylation response protein AidB-like acyl-CoA dehydrogenase
MSSQVTHPVQTLLRPGSLARRIAWRKDQGMPFEKEAAMAKLYTSEMCGRVTDKAVQIHGGYGYTKEYAIERIYRDARVLSIYEGTSEIQRNIIAQRGLGLPRD